MSYDDYSPPPSGTFGRSNSVDYSNSTTYATHETAPNFSSAAVGNSERQFPPNSQRALPPADQVVSLLPVLEHVRPPVISSKQLTDGIGNRAWDPTADYDGQPQDFSDLGHRNNSVDPVTGDNGTEGAAPTMSVAAQRDPSNNGASDGTETVDPLDYAGISSVVKRFKLLNPEAYYVEKDDPEY